MNRQDAIPIPGQADQHDMLRRSLFQMRYLIINVSWMLHDQ